MTTTHADAVEQARLASPTTATFVILKPGREVRIKPGLRFGFTRARLLRLITPIERAIHDGGYYTVLRLDGPEDLRDLTLDLHRSVFVPTKGGAS